MIHRILCFFGIHYPKRVSTEAFAHQYECPCCGHKWSELMYP